MEGQKRLIRCKDCDRELAESRDDNQFLRVGNLDIWNNARLSSIACKCGKPLWWKPTEPEVLMTDEDRRFEKEELKLRRRITKPKPEIKEVEEI